MREPVRYTVVYSSYHKRTNWERITAMTSAEAYQIKNNLEECGYYVRGVYPEYK